MRTCPLNCPEPAGEGAMPSGNSSSPVEGTLRLASLAQGGFLYKRTKIEYIISIINLGRRKRPCILKNGVNYKRKNKNNKRR